MTTLFNIQYNIKMPKSKSNPIPLIQLQPSSIPNQIQGLFATQDIPPNTILLEFKGRLNHNSPTSPESIFFKDNTYLHTIPSCLASKVNDCAKFPKHQRSLNDIFKSELPIYECLIENGPNAIILTKDNVHKAFLQSIQPIKKGEQIYIHRGFMSCLAKEHDILGFKNETFTFNIDKFFDYESVKKYIKIFFPNVKETKLEIINGKHWAIIIEENGKENFFPIGDVFKTVVI